MKSTRIYSFGLLLLLIATTGLGVALAQNSVAPPGSSGLGNSLPAPGTGGSFHPAPVAPNPGPWGPPSWGPTYWGPPYYGSPYVVSAPLSSPYWQNAGTENVIGVGYDYQGVWRTIPMTVQYSYDGAQYDVTVVNAYDPWTQSWNTGVYEPAYNTYYYLRGTYYNYYTDLSTGTYYFNL